MSLDLDRVRIWNIRRSLVEKSAMFWCFLTKKWVLVTAGKTQGTTTGLVFTTVIFHGQLQGWRIIFRERIGNKTCAGTKAKVTRVTRACMGSLWNSSHPNAVFCTCCTILRCVMLRTTCCEADGEVTWQFPWNLWLPLGCAAWMLQEYSALEGTWKTFSSYGLPRAPHHFSKKAAEWSTATRMEYDIYWHIISLLKHDSKTGFHLSTFLLAPKKIPQSRYSSMVPLLALLSHSFMQQK